MKVSLKGKWALVTGASSGIGFEMAKDLAGKGMNLILVARREAELKALSLDLAARFGVCSEYMVSDLAKLGEPELLYEAVLKKNINVSVLVNNAGFGAHGEFDDIGADVERDMLTLNIDSLARLTRLFAGSMRQAGFGRLLFTSSIGAFMPSPSYATYCATKSFVLSYALAIREELRGTGITVSVLYPGVTETAFHKVAGHETAANAFKRHTAMDAETVAKAGVHGMIRGTAEIIPGLLNKIMIFMTRFLSRPALAEMSARLMK